MEDKAVVYFLNKTSLEQNHHPLYPRRDNATIAIAAMAAVMLLSATTIVGPSNLTKQQLAFAATAPGGIFVTGHDPDYHASAGGNNAGAEHIIQHAIAYVTNNNNNNTSNLKILLVTDLRNSTGPGYSDPRLGMNAAGFTKFDVADYGSGTPGTLDLHKVNFTSYDVVVVASSFGGWLRQDELKILNNRSADLISYINKGGGLVAFAEPSYRFVGWNVSSFYPGNNTDTTLTFGFIPFVVSETPLGQPEEGFKVTEFGASELGLNDSDVNGNFAHNIFTNTGGMNIVDVDAAGNAVSLAIRNMPVGPQGVQDTTPPTITPPGNVIVECNTYGGAKDVNLGIANATDNSDPNPIVTNNAENTTATTTTTNATTNNNNTAAAPTTKMFPLGNTTVIWKVVDKSGNSATANQTVTVVDTIPPNLTISIIGAAGSSHQEVENNNVNSLPHHHSPRHSSQQYQIVPDAKDICDPHPTIKTAISINTDQPASHQHNNKHKPSSSSSSTFIIKITATDASGNTKSKELIIDEQGVKHKNNNNDNTHDDKNNNILMIIKECSFCMFLFWESETADDDNDGT